MPNVGFKIGTQDNLNALLKLGTGANAVNGTFYLTSNTNRLYIGKADGSIAPVNAGIITVDRVSRKEGDPDTYTYLPTAGSPEVVGNYYYASRDNILCVYNGNTWVQINAIVTNKGIAQTAASTATGASLHTVLTDSRNEYVEQTFNVDGGAGISVTGSGSTITVAAEGLTVETATNDNVAKSTFSVVGSSADLEIAGGDNVTISSTGNKITINAADDIHVTKINVAPQAEGGFNILGTTNKNEAIEAGLLDPTVTVGKETDAQSTVHFKNGNAALDVYTTGEVDAMEKALKDLLENKLQTFNAMEYQGTVGSDSIGQAQLPPDGSLVKSGYAYLVSGTLDYDGVKYPSGTLVVASGIEDSDTGYLTNITWNFVTGSTADTTYEGVVGADGSVMLIEKPSNNTAISLNVTAGQDLELDKKTSGSEQVYALKHATYEDPTPASSNADAMSACATYEIEAITGLTLSNGHIKGIQTKKYTVTDTNIKAISTTASIGDVTTSEGTTSAVINHSTILTNSANSAIKADTDASFVIESSSLEISKNANANNVLAMNLVWGTF